MYRNRKRKRAEGHLPLAQAMAQAGPAHSPRIGVFLPAKPSCSLERELADATSAAPEPSRPPRAPSPRHDSAQTSPLLSLRSPLPLCPSPRRFPHRPKLAGAPPCKPRGHRPPSAPTWCPEEEALSPSSSRASNQAEEPLETTLASPPRRRPPWSTTMIAPSSGLP